MRVRVRRALIILAAVAVGLTLAVIAAVHTPMARSRALAWSANFLTRYHLELEAGNLAYNAVTRRITLTDVRLAAEGHKDRPFLVAKRIEVRLPWSVFRRRFAEKGRYRRYLTPIPAYVITHPLPALIGLAALLDRRIETIDIPRDEAAAQRRSA